MPFILSSSYILTFLFSYFSLICLFVYLFTSSVGGNVSGSIDIVKQRVARETVIEDWLKVRTMLNFVRSHINMYNSMLL